MNDQRNLILALVLSAAVLLGWALISDKYFPTANKPSTEIVKGKEVALPTPSSVASAPALVRDRNVVLASSPRVKILTPKLAGSINLMGAQLDDLTISNQRETIDKNSPPVRLFSPAGTQDAYFTRYGWSGQGVALPNANTVWTATGDILAPGKPVTLSWNNQQGQSFAIKFEIDENYLFTVQQSVTNGAGQPVSVRTYDLISRTGLPKDVAGNSHIGPVGVFGGGADYDVNYQNLQGQEPGIFARFFGTTAKAGDNYFDAKGGWLGFGDKYWLTALIPDQAADVNDGFRGAPGSEVFEAAFMMAPAPIGTGKTIVQSSRLFAGAKEVSLLDDYENRLSIPHFSHAIDWGWFRFIEKPIFYLLDWLFKLVGNFGLAIILLTLIVRGVMFPIAQRQFRSANQMKAVQPRLKALQEKHKEDKLKLQEEMMKLYKAEKINPVAGCLPVFLQIPIFFSLYKVLTLTLEMRHQPFVFWIRDLSAPDPLTPVNLFGYLPFQPTGFLHLSVLAILLGGTMWLQFKLNPQMNMDPAQKQIFALMPWFMMFIMSPFAAGLQVYYIMSNLLTVGQMQLLAKRSPAPPPVPAKQ